MYTTLRQLVKTVGFEDVASQFTMVFRDIQEALDIEIPVYLVGENHNKHWYYLVDHPDGFEGANHNVLVALKDIKIYREREVRPYSDWENLRDDIDEDGDFLGDYNDYDSAISKHWWVAFNKPITLFQYDNKQNLRKLNKETPFE